MPRPKSAGPTPMAVTSSLNSVYISPRTPRTPRVVAEHEDDDVEMELLAEEERERARRGLETEPDVPVKNAAVAKKFSAKDKRSMVLLCVLCERTVRGCYGPLN